MAKAEVINPSIKALYIQGPDLGYKIDPLRESQGILSIVAEGGKLIDSKAVPEKEVEIAILSGHGYGYNRNQKDANGKSTERATIGIFEEEELHDTVSAILAVNEKTHPSTFIISGCYEGAAVDSIKAHMWEFASGTTFILQASSKYSTHAGMADRSLNRLFDEVAQDKPFDEVAFFAQESVLNAESQVIMKVVGEGEEKRMFIVKSRAPKSPENIINLDGYLSAPPARYDDKDKMRDKQGVVILERAHKNNHLVVMSGNEDDEKLVDFLTDITSLRSNALTNRSAEQLQGYKNDAFNSAIARGKIDRAQEWAKQGAASNVYFAIKEKDDVEYFKLAYAHDELAKANPSIFWKNALDRQAPKIAAFLCAQMKPEEKASALLDAIEKGEYSYIAFLRETGVDINAPLDVYGNTAFHRFIEKKQSLVIIIAEGGADVDKPNHYGNRPMHIAALYNNEQAIIGLSGCGADVNATNNLGETPLHVAAKHGNQSAVNMLLKRNADLTLKDNLGQSIIDVATPQMRVIIEKFSLDKMAYVELDAILAEGDLNKLKDVAKKWFGHIDGEGKEGLTILAKTVLSGNHSAAEILLDAGANPNEALINAVMSDSGVMVKMLILAGADPKRELRGGQKLLDMASPENKSAVERVIEEALAERQLIVEADAIKARIQAKQELFLKQQKVLMDQSALMEKGLATLAVLSEGSASGVARLKELTRKHLSIKQKMMEGMNLGGLVEGLGENVDRIEGAKPTPKVQSTVASLIARSGNSKT